MVDYRERRQTLRASLPPLDILASDLGLQRRGDAWQCPDPAHTDQNKAPTLSVSPTLGWKCHGQKHSGTLPQGGPLELVTLARGGDWQDAETWLTLRYAPELQAEPKSSGDSSRPLPPGLRYHYPDGLVVVDRRQHSGGYVQWQADPLRRGFGWPGAPTPPPTGRPLYRAASLRQNSPLALVVEGEGTVEKILPLWPYGPVVTWAGGAGNWSQTDWTPLATREDGEEVVVAADADTKGRQAAIGICQRLRTLNPSLRIRAHLPAGEDGTDLADLTAGWGDLEERERGLRWTGLDQNLEAPPEASVDAGNPSSLLERLEGLPSSGIA